MINRIVLVGRLTRDPIITRTANDTLIASFTLAVDDRTRDADGKPTASFIPVKVFNQGAKIVSDYVKQGTLLGVEGRLKQSSFKRKDETTGSKIEVIADSISLLSPKGSSASVRPAVEEKEEVEEDSTNVDDLFNDEESPF